MLGRPGQQHAYANTHPDTYANTYPNANTYANADTNSDTYPNTNSHSYPERHDQHDDPVRYVDGDEFGYDDCCGWCNV